MTTTLLPSADALCTYLEKNQVLWAIGFYALPSGADPFAARNLTMSRDARARIVPLVFPVTLGPEAFVPFGQGKYTEAVLRGYIQPQGPLRGVGEIPLYKPGMLDTTFDSPVMQTVFQVVNEIKGVVMVHPRSAGLGRGATEASEIEAALLKYPNVTFLFHGGTYVVDLVFPLMSKYPNVYYTWDVASMMEGPWGNLMFPQGVSPREDYSERFVADVNRVGADRIVEHVVSVLLPRLQQHPDRIMWGTDQAMFWHFKDPAAEMIINVSRQVIARLPVDHQEAYAFRNALRIFGPYLSPSP